MDIYYELLFKCNNLLEVCLDYKGMATVGLNKLRLQCWLGLYIVN